MTLDYIATVRRLADRRMVLAGYWLPLGGCTEAGCGAVDAQERGGAALYEHPPTASCEDMSYETETIVSPQFSVVLL